MDPTRNSRTLDRLLAEKANPNPHQEKRKGGRFVTIAVKSELGLIVDLSARGARIRAKGRPVVQRDDLVDFTLICEDRSIAINAKVTWVKTLDTKQFEVGVEFDKLSIEQSAAIRDIAMKWSPGFMFRDPHRLK